MLVLLVLLAAGEGRPLFYWGARPAVLTAEAVGAPTGTDARVTELHAAIDPRGLVVRFTFDREARSAMQLPDGTPVSGRLRAVLYLDADDDRQTGLSQGPLDPRTGAERRLEVGVVSVGEDAEEQRKASAVLTATLSSLDREGRRKTLWRADGDGSPSEVSAHGEWVEVRLPPAILAPTPPIRMILAAGDRTFEGRLAR
jgi:hypothetical protein